MATEAIRFLYKKIAILEIENERLKNHNAIFFTTIKNQITEFENTPLFEDGTHKLTVDYKTLDALKQTLIDTGYKF